MSRISFGKKRRGVSFSLACLHKKQTYKNIEVIISDHSVDDSLMKLWQIWKEDTGIDSIYVSNSNNRGSSESNLNNAISLAEGDFIKPMYQDDFFHSENALELMVKKLEESQERWVVASTWHCKEDATGILYNLHVPRIPDEISTWLLGINTLGSPSVMMYEKFDEYFDPLLVWLPDTEFYYRMGKKRGYPSIVEEPCVVTRMRKDSITETQITDEVFKNEVEYNTCKHISKERINLKDYNTIYERANLLKLL